MSTTRALRVAWPVSWPFTESPGSPRAVQGVPGTPVQHRCPVPGGALPLRVVPPSGGGDAGKGGGPRASRCSQRSAVRPKSLGSVHSFTHPLRSFIHSPTLWSELPGCPGTGLRQVVRDSNIKQPCLLCCPGEREGPSVLCTWTPSEETEGKPGALRWAGGPGRAAGEAGPPRPANLPLG